MIHFLTRRPSEEFVWDYANRIKDGGGPEADVICYEDALGEGELPSGVYVFTGLARFGNRLTAALDVLHKQIADGVGREPLNHPSESLRRYELLKALFERGMNRFRVWGAWEGLDEIEYPVFVRDRSQHGGIPVLLHSRREVEKEIGWALVRGADLTELIIVEFLDTREPDGLYRKYSAYVVGDQVMPVSLERGHSWVLRHPDAEFDVEALDEERRFVLADPHRGQLEEVREIARMGFGRIDYSILDGRVQTWEINTLPTMRRPPGVPPFPDHLRPHRQVKMDLFKQRFAEAWGHLVSQIRPSGPVKLNLPEALVSPALRELAAGVPATFRHQDRYDSIKSLFRPMKAVFMPLAGRTVVPFLARRTIRKTLKGEYRLP